jgi:hypothetical protein
LTKKVVGVFVRFRAIWMNEGHLIRAHETFEDLLKNQIHYHKTIETVLK